MLKAGTEASKAKETARHNKAMEDLTSKYQKGMIEARGKPRPLSPEEANLKKAQAAKIWSQIGRNKAGERLSPVMMRGIVEMAKLPSLLKEIEKGIVGVKDKFGPVWGGIAKRNPWDNAAQIYTKDVNMFAETLVKAIQGSRPSDYDAKRYMALAPQLDATYEVAADRLKKLRQAFEYEQALTYHILKAQGFNMAGVPKPKNVVDPLTGATPMSVAAKMDMTFATHSGGTDKKNMTREQKIQLLKKLEAEKQK
ncbi:MAG: hypothetical protein EHM49_05745 [Deltaproteobacteria bacterium]|nr:MAG: hypothetical protein EHM49_05745 [Deltaproteobacteria bacterium]